MPSVGIAEAASGRLLRQELPQLSGLLLTPLNTLHTRGIYAKVQLASGLSHWRFQYARKEARRWVKFKAGDKHLWLAMDAGHWSRRVNDRDWWEFDQEHQALSFILAHEEFLDHLQELTGISWQVEAINDHVSFSPETNISLKYSVECREQLTSGVIDLCQATLSALVQRPVWERVDLPVQGFITKLPIKLVLEINALPLSMAELATFQQGDVLLAGPQEQLKSNLVLLHALSRRPLWNVIQNQNGYRLRGRCQDTEPDSERLIPLSELTSQEINSLNKDDSHMSQDQTTAEPAFDVDQLPVEIRIQVGQITLTIEELNQLEPGHTLPLPMADQSKEATLIANGRSVGQGELVMVGDQLGIRITQLG